MRNRLSPQNIRSSAYLPSIPWLKIGKTFSLLVETDLPLNSITSGKYFPLADLHSFPNNDKSWGIPLALSLSILGIPIAKEDVAHK
jgi:hypothetical protein